MCELKKTVENCYLFSLYSVNGFHTYPKYLERQAQAKCIESDQKPQNAASDQGLLCLPLIQ